MAAQIDLRNAQIAFKSTVCFETVDDAIAAIRQHEKATTTRFTTYISPKDFGGSDVKSKNRKVYWEHGDKSTPRYLPFDGVPFIILSTKVFECQHGPDRNTGNKMKFHQKRKDTLFAKNRFLKHDTKKFGCDAKLFLYEVVKFPDYVIKRDTVKRRTINSAALRKQLLEGCPVQQRPFYLSLPLAENHSGHTIGEIDWLATSVGQLDEGDFGAVG